ncbi:hypothetical protein P5F55_14005 [Clostridium perfringens]|uniref:hypothetical protein n=1 Tax=Clostridium perfringens TaxID=1502 RepID=UPI002972DEC7|nr:hypothetical protein [Clostridium perfringens]MDK0834979.1 hypothetical protein [Clostridium perfringens]MDK0928476.1 hypothetical protein [Clostridium perfringens]MDM0495299.1 hypothetical protein [Clostridium perfringens]MDM0781015.1 hypothetical protein [Clostridium perfringens]
MAKQKKVVTIELDKERHLYYTLNSLELIEKLIGTSIDKLGENMNMSTLKVLLYAGLKHEDKNITVDEVGELVGFEDIEKVSEAINEAFKGLN